MILINAKFSQFSSQFCWDKRRNEAFKFCVRFLFHSTSNLPNFHASCAMPSDIPVNNWRTINNSRNHFISKNLYTIGNCCWRYIYCFKNDCITILRLRQISIIISWEFFNTSQFVKFSLSRSFSFASCLGSFFDIENKVIWDMNWLQSKPSEKFLREFSYSPHKRWYAIRILIIRTFLKLIYKPR